MTAKEEKAREEKDVEKINREEREVVVPGEIIVSGNDYLAGEGTKRREKDIIATRYGLAEKSDRLVKVIPLSGIYMARRGNTVIGKVIDITFNGWLLDINSPYSSFLSVAECPRFINKNDLSECFDIGDMLAVKVYSVKRKGIDLTTKARGLGKLEGGIIIQINSNKVPRVIGKAGSMINLIKEATGCDITVGQNGIIWIRGNKVEDELFAEQAIRFVTEKSFIEGLTEKTKEWLEEQKKGEKKEKSEKKTEIKKEKTKEK